MIVPSLRLLRLAALVILPAAAAAGFVPGLFAPCAGLIALCAIAAALDAVRGRRRIAALQIRTPRQVRLTKDLPASLPLTIDNASALPLLIGVRAVMPAGVALDKLVLEFQAPAGASTLDCACTATARGDHRLGELHVETLSLFGLWQVRARRTVDCTFRVYPNLRDHATAALFQKTAAAGLRVLRMVGRGREFDNLRQYMPGDSFEDIHWKATARRGYPAVKLYRMEHAQEVYVVIDASRLSMRDGILEQYIGAALHLALVAERQGDRFGLVTFSDRTQRFVRARSGLDHFRLCRETIYNLRAERVSPGFREVFTSLQLNLRRRSLLIFFTSLDDALLAETFEREIPMLARRHVVLVNVTQTPGLKPLFSSDPPADLDSVYAGLAGQILWNRMRKLKIALQNRGVKLAIAEPARLKAEVTAEYLDVKRRQVL